MSEVIERYLKFTREAMFYSRQNGKTNSMIEWALKNSVQYKQRSVLLVHNRVEARRVEKIINTKAQTRDSGVTVLSLGQLIKGEGEGLAEMNNLMVDQFVFTVITEGVLEEYRSARVKISNLRKKIDDINSDKALAMKRINQLESELKKKRSWWKFWKKD